MNKVRQMNKYTWAVVCLALVLIASSCGGVGKARSKVNQIERGMTKGQITALLGAPKNKSVQDDGTETWEYVYTDILSRQLDVTVTFAQDRVSKYDSRQSVVEQDRHVSSGPVVPIPSPVPTPVPGGYPDPRVLEEEARAFEDFYGEVRRIPFEEERIGFIQSVARRSLFTVDQAGRLITLFHWDEQRLALLEALAPRLRNGYNAFRLLELFSYGPAQDRARQILERVPPVPREYDPRYGGQVEPRESVEEFLSAVERQTWDKDKIRYIQDAARYNSFTVAQVARLLKLFTWDKEKLQVLEAVALRIRDGYNAYRLIDLFDFDSAQQQARRILGLTE